MLSFGTQTFRLGGVLFLAGSLLLLFGQAPSRAKAKPPEVVEELLGEMGSVFETHVSPDYRQVLHLVRKGTAWKVYFDLKEVVAFEAAPNLTRADLPFGETVVFGPEGGKYAFRLRDDAAERVYLNGKAGAEHPANSIRAMEFSKDGSHFGYVVNEAGKGGRAVIDGVEGKTFPGVVSFSLSPDGARNALFANAGKQWQLVVDGKPLGTYEGFMLPYKSPSPYFSADGKRVAVGVARKKKWVTVVDGRESREYDRIAEAPRFSVDGRRVAFVALEGEKRIAVVDDVEFSEPGVTFANLGEELPFSPDGKRTAFFVRPPNPMSQFVLVDGKKGPDFTRVEAFRFSGDSRHFGFVATRGRQRFVVHDGDEWNCDWSDPETFAVSHDGSRWACVAQKPPYSVVVENGKEGTPYLGIFKPAFSADGRHLAYRAVRDATDSAQRAVLVLDGAEVLRCERFVVSNRTLAPSLSFDKQGRVNCLIERGGKVLRVQVTPK